MKLTKKLIFLKEFTLQCGNHESIAKTEVKIKSASKVTAHLTVEVENKQIVTTVTRRLPKSMAFAQETFRNTMKTGPELQICLLIQ